MRQNTFISPLPSSETVGETLKYILWNQEEGRVRAGWRIVILILAVLTLSQLILMGAEHYLGPRPRSGPGRTLLTVSVLSLATTLCVPLARRFLDQRRFVSLGLEFDDIAIKDLAFGWVLAGAMSGTFFLILLSSDGLDISGFAWQNGPVARPLLLNLAAAVLAGWSLELFLRGYVFDNFVSTMGMNPAVAVSCAMYVLFHVAVSEPSLWSMMVVAAAGFLRIFGLLSTRQLWLSMGVQMGWTFFNGPIFGFEPGIANAFRLIRHSTSGTPWFAGGAFGSEGSVLMLPIIAAAAGAMYLWSHRVRWDSHRG